MSNDEQDNAREDYRQGARNRKIFTTTDYVMGLPGNVLMGCGAVVGATFILFTWFAALFMALLILPVMYHIHKDDPRALSLWKDAIIERHTSWEAGTTTSRELVILKD